MEMNVSLSPVVAYLDHPHTTTPQQPSSLSNSMTMASIKTEEPAPGTITPELLQQSPSRSVTPRPGDSRSVKKRKSWGQVLPEPKTNLPPRKRAKTADEKEQRRIERVKRNRLAAHNSRERKREEMEKLEDQNTALQERIHQLEAELAAYKTGRTGSVASFNFSTPTHKPSVASTHMISPALTAYTEHNTTLSTPELRDLDSPGSDDYSQPATPEPEEAPLREAALIEPTQQSAALLCDLQCRSMRRSSSSPSSPPSPSLPSAPRGSSTQQTAATTALLVSWLNLQLFLSSLSTLSSTLTRTLPTLAFASPTAQTLFAATCWTTMLARLPTSSTYSPTLMRDLSMVATSLAQRLRTAMPCSSLASSRLSREERRRRVARRSGGGGTSGRGRDERGRVQRRRERYERSSARTRTSYWVTKREIQLACDSLGVRAGSSSLAAARAGQKSRAREVLIGRLAG